MTLCDRIHAAQMIITTMHVISVMRLLRLQVELVQRLLDMGLDTSKVDRL
jgi:hypothetical protein